MSRLESRESGYEIGEEIVAGDGFRVYRATERTTGSPCFYHRVECPKGLTSTIEQSILATVRRYGMLRAPRTPRLVDGWITDDHIGVVEFKEVGMAVGPANNPFQSKGRHRPDFFEETLHLMVALNRCNIVHSVITAGCFLTGRQGKIFLDDTGVDRALVRCATSDLTSQFTLANNLSGLDVAQWASMVIGLHTGEPLIDQTLGERWDEYELEQAIKKLRSHKYPEELFEFFRRCLNGYVGSAPLFESASDALRAWQVGKLGGLVK